MKFKNTDLYFVIPDFSTNQCLEKRPMESEVKQSFASFAGEIIKKFSSYIRLVRAISYIIRFFRSAKYKVCEKSIILSKKEFDLARIYIIRLCHSLSFNAEICMCFKK